MNALLERAISAVNIRVTRSWSPHALPSRSKAPIASFTFDDFPRSAATEGARVLKDFGARGTYFVSGSRKGRNLDGLDQFVEQDLVDVADAGHEIGCHTFGHVALSSISRSQITADLEKNTEFVHSILGNCTLSSFAYPYGHVTLSTKSFIGRHFPICRGIWGGVNRGRIDFMQLKAVSLERSFDQTHVEELLDEAKRANGWIIFFTHDVSDQPSPYGCTPGQLAGVLQAVVERGIEILPVKNAAGRMRFA